MHDPATVLYLMLLMTSLFAARSARSVGHKGLCNCYIANSAIYGALGVFHALNGALGPG